MEDKKNHLWHRSLLQMASRLSIRFSLLLLIGLSPLWAYAGTMGTTGTTANWTSHGGTLEGIHYSELADINLGTIGTLAKPQLVEEFAFQTGVNGSHMGTPLVVGTTLYVVTPFPNKLVAYNLTNGSILWTFTPHVRPYAFGVNCCDTVNRGPAYANGLVVYNTLDDTTVAVDATSGAQVWQTTLADPHTGVTTNGATLIVPNQAVPGSWLVIVGSSSGEMGVRGWVKALDLMTGALKWTAYTTGSDADVMIGANYKPFYLKDKGVDQGISSWDADKWKQGGSSAWGYMTYDSTNDLLFYGTSQPGVWNADQRPGDNKWGASIFARKASTGAAIWAYQVTPHDQWDYDAISESTPLDLATPITTSSGQHSQILVHFNKNGFAYTFDRLTGEILSAPNFGAVQGSQGSINWADHIDLVTGLPALNLDQTTTPPQPIKATHQGVVTNNICPSAMGMKGWEPTAFSPRTKLFYVPTFNLCMNYQGLKTEYIAGAPYMGMSMSVTLGPGGPFMGEMVAWDVVNGGRMWSQPEPAPVYGGVLATAGDLIFYGTLDNTFKARNAITGELLFKTTLECSTVGSPISFTGPDGKQRIAVFAGVGWLAGGFTASQKPCPGRTGSETTTATNGGGRVHVFKLP